MAALESRKFSGELQLQEWKDLNSRTRRCCMGAPFESRETRQRQRERNDSRRQRAEHGPKRYFENSPTAEQRWRRSTSRPYYGVVAPEYSEGGSFGRRDSIPGGPQQIGSRGDVSKD